MHQKSARTVLKCPQSGMCEAKADSGHVRGKSVKPFLSITGHACWAGPRHAQTRQRLNRVHTHLVQTPSGKGSEPGRAITPPITTTRITTAAPRKIDVSIDDRS